MKASIITPGHGETVPREALLHPMVLVVALLIQAVTKYDLIPPDLTFVTG